MSDADKQRANELIGRATFWFRDPNVNETDKQQLTELVGLLSARFYETAMIERLVKLERQLADLNEKLETLQTKPAVH